MPSYYAEKLAADRLRQVYDLASPRIRQYLDAEVAFVAKHIKPTDHILELGCGYGRILPTLCGIADHVVGIDTAAASIHEASESLQGIANLSLAVMDASRTAFADSTFDCVVCIQNGISAFHIDQMRLISEAVRITKPGGTVLFSSYAESFWPHRLAWFEVQSEAGLLGPIDYNRTGNGIIICKDGFTATTVSPADFRRLTDQLGVAAEITEVDQSSVFCVITRPDRESERVAAP